MCCNGKAHQSAMAPRHASKAYLPDGRQGCIEQGLEQLGVLRSCGEECLQLLQDVLQIGSVLLLHGCNVSGAELRSKCHSSPCVVSPGDTWPSRAAEKRTRWMRAKNCSTGLRLPMAHCSGQSNIAYLAARLMRCTVRRVMRVAMPGVSRNAASSLAGSPAMSARNPRVWRCKQNVHAYGFSAGMALTAPAMHIHIVGQPQAAAARNARAPLTDSAAASSVYAYCGRFFDVTFLPLVAIVESCQAGASYAGVTKTRHSLAGHHIHPTSYVHLTSYSSAGFLPDLTCLRALFWEV
jgi:hypothetical protein